MSIRNSILKEFGAVAFMGLALVAAPASSFAEDVEPGYSVGWGKWAAVRAW